MIINEFVLFIVFCIEVGWNDDLLLNSLLFFEGNFIQILRFSAAFELLTVNEYRAEG